MGVSTSTPFLRPASPGTRRRLALDVVVLGAATVLLRLPALLASRHLTFDDGVFGASAVAMRDGALPFRDVFSSQGPLFLPLVWVADAAGLRTLDAPRLVGTVSAVVLVLATYAAGRQITDRAGALLAAGLVSVAGSILWTTGPVSADGPALAFATTAVALALAYRRAPTTTLAIAAGLALGAALSVKSIVLPAALAVGLVLLVGRRPRDLLAAVAAAVAVGLAATVPWGFADVWDQAVVYHLEASDERTPLANLGKVLSTLGDRDLVVLAAAATAAVATWWRRRGRPRDAEARGVFDRLATPGGLLAIWLLATLLLLVLEDPLWRPHVAHLVPPLALLAGWRRAPWPTLIAVGLFIVPYQIVHTSDILWPAPYGERAAAVTASLRELPEDALVISDEPGLVWRAGHATPPDLVDTSVLRIDSQRITTDSLARAASAPEVCAVVVWSSRFRSLDGLPQHLRDIGYRVAAEYPGDRALWTRPDCEP